MLEKPDLADDKIIACVLDEYGLQADHFKFLPLGADQEHCSLSAHQWQSGCVLCQIEARQL